MDSNDLDKLLKSKTKSDESILEKFITWFIIILGSVSVVGIMMIIATIYGAFAWGFLLYKFWYWFILPVFPALTHITFYQAVGLWFFISLFKGLDYSAYNQHNKDKDEQGYKDFEKVKLWSGILGPWLLLLIGYFIGYYFIF